MTPKNSSDLFQQLIDSVSASARPNSSFLQTGHFLKDSTRTAVYFTGKRSVVFAFQQEKKSRALKIWPQAKSDFLRNHYANVEKHLSKLGLNCFMNTSYLKEAINLNGADYDVLLMDWVGRQNIKEYICSNIDRTENIEALAEKILCLHKTLNEAGVSHGRLHTGNIYIDANNELKLIGYDSIFINGTTNAVSNDALAGYPDYCHPSGNNAKIKADYFAALILYLGIKAMAANIALWGRYKVGFQEGLIFKAEDFIDIKNTDIYKHLRKIKSGEIDKLLDVLVIYCEEQDAANLKPFYIYLEEHETLFATQNVNKENKAPLEKTDIEDTDHIRKNISIILPAQNRTYWANDYTNNASLSNISAENLADENTNTTLVSVDEEQNKDLKIDEKNNKTSTVSLTAIEKIISGILPNEEASIFEKQITNNIPVETSASIKKVAPAVFENRSSAVNTNKVSLKAQKKIKQKKQASNAFAKQKRRAFAGSIIICSLILASGYFFGELQDKLNSTSFEIKSLQQKQQNETVKKDVPVLTPLKTKNNSLPADSSVTNKPAAITDIAINQKKDSVTVTNATAYEQAEKKSLNNPGNLPADMADKSAIAMISKSNSRKLPGKKAIDSEKENTVSFKIGLPPKE